MLDGITGSLVAGASLGAHAQVGDRRITGSLVAGAPAAPPGRRFRYVWRIDMPPSTGIVAPLTKLALGRQRASVMWATSSGWP